MWKGKNQDAEKHDTECLELRSHLSKQKMSGYDGVQTNGFAPVKEYHACLEKGK